jgi:hypothetical protein
VSTLSDTAGTHAGRPPRVAPRLVDEPGIRFALAEAALALVVLSAGLLTLPPRDALVVVAVAALLAGGYVVRPFTAVGLGLSAWACWTGFLDHHLGQLTVAGADLDRMFLLIGMALAGVVLHRTLRRSLHRSLGAVSRG